MYYQKDPRPTIIALKGLPITIAAILHLYPQPVSSALLGSLLSCSDKTLSTALSKLQEFQMVDHSSQGWTITASVVLLGFSLPVWLQPAEETGQSGETCPVDKPVEKGRNISDSPATTSSIKIINNNNNNNKDLVVDPKIKNLAKADVKPKSLEMIRDCHQAAHNAGIGEPKATFVANLPHTTPEMIKKYVRDALAKKQKIGLAIHWLEHGRRDDNNPGQDFTEQEELDRQDRQRYVTGRYADWIIH